MRGNVGTAMRLLAAVTLTALLISPVAMSQPPSDGGVSAAPTLPLVQLGAPADLAFYGIQGTETLTIPVPSGLAPVALDVTTQLPVNVQSATVTVMQEDRTLSRVDIPPGERVSVSIPLAGAEIVDNAVTVILRSYLLPVPGYCLDPTNPLRFSDGAVAFAGVEIAPTVVADFLPPVLRQLTIFVSGEPSQAESDATVRLATAVAAQFGSQAPDIIVAPLPDRQSSPPGPSAPLQRQILIREGPDVGVFLVPTDGVPALIIEGPPDALANQSRLLASDVNRLALASKAVAGPLRSTPQLPGDQTTLRRLGQPGVNAVALSPQVNIGLDQTRLGRSAHGLRVHLQGSYTPLPESIGGQLVASIAGETIDRWPADPSGAIDRWVDVPDRLLQRYTNLGLRLDISGDTGRCGEFQPLTLTIDGESPVLSSPADPPVPGGFQSMPQSLMPRTVVGLGGGFDDLRRATDIMVGLQRLSALPIDTSVMPLADAVADSAPAVLVSAERWTDDTITLPIEPGADGELTVQRAGEPGETTTLTLDPALRFGSLQTVYDDGRSMLVATSNDAPEQVDALLSWLGENVQRWSGLDGTAVIATADRQPVVYGATQSEEQDTDESSAPNAGLPWWAWAAIALAAVSVVLAVAVIVARARRKSPTS